MVDVYARLTREEEEACDLLGMDKNKLMIARQREIDALPEMEKQVCEKLGVNPLDYLKMKNLENEEQRALNSLSPDELKVCRATGMDPVEFFKNKMTGC
ncbi:MAG: hypothetical protein F9K32_13080 [Desulfobulbaceae bacterium]|nr:MAG: hypothetical protein F9K32_13080 [Desulfobulbaceae bacterium]